MGTAAFTGFDICGRGSVNYWCVILVVVVFMQSIHLDRILMRRALFNWPAWEIVDSVRDRSKDNLVLHCLR